VRLERQKLWGLAQEARDPLDASPTGIEDILRGQEANFSHDFSSAGAELKIEG
jgi:hypothetical protein